MSKRLYLNNLPHGFTISQLNEKLQSQEVTVEVLRTSAPEKNHYAILEAPETVAEKLLNDLKDQDFGCGPIEISEARPRRPYRQPRTPSEPRRSSQPRRSPQRRSPRRQENPESDAPASERPQREERPRTTGRPRFPFWQNIYRQRQQRRRAEATYQPNTTANDGKSVFIDNLSYRMTQQDLTEFLKAENLNISSCKLLTVSFWDRRTETKQIRSLGRGYVNFHSAEDAKAFMDKYTGQEVHGRKLRTQPARTGPRVRSPQQ
ncbi:hypothetical protein RCL1_000236 [Eukaryota sp. TZLM3-RCL]